VKQYVNVEELTRQGRVCHSLCSGRAVAVRSAR